jgi:type IV pilus assembly protein PilE
MEVLVVLLIIGIITNLVLPKLLPLVTKAKTTEAKLQLNHLYTLERGYYYENSRYASSLVDVGFEQERLVSDGGQANYKLRILTSGPSSFQATATSVVDFDEDGAYNTWQIDQNRVLTEIIPD